MGRVGPVTRSSPYGSTTPRAVRPSTTELHLLTAVKFQCLLAVNPALHTLICANNASTRRLNQVVPGRFENAMRRRARSPGAGGGRHGQEEGRSTAAGQQRGSAADAADAGASGVGLALRPRRPPAAGSLTRFRRDAAILGVFILRVAFFVLPAKLLPLGEHQHSQAKPASQPAAALVRRRAYEGGHIQRAY